MLAGLPLSLQQLSPLSLQFRSAQFQSPVLPVQLTAELDKVGYFFFERLDEVVSHEGYTVSVASPHYNARRFIGSMRDRCTDH